MANANSRILGYRQSLSKIDKPFLTMLDKLCLHFLCSCLQFSVLTRFVCRICLHFGQVLADFLQTKFLYRVCLSGLLVQTKFVCRTAADKVCLHVHEFVCNIHKMTNLVYSRQTLYTSMTNFIYRSLSVRIWPGPGGWGVLEGGARAVMPTYGFALGDILAAWPGLSAL